jgi:hypothetical protein
MYSTTVSQQASNAREENNLRIFLESMELVPPGEFYSWFLGLFRWRCEDVNKIGWLVEPSWSCPSLIDLLIQLTPLGGAEFSIIRQIWWTRCGRPSVAPRIRWRHPSKCSCKNPGGNARRAVAASMGCLAQISASPTVEPRLWTLYSFILHFARECVI